MKYVKDANFPFSEEDLVNMKKILKKNGRVFDLNDLAGIGPRSVIAERNGKDGKITEYDLVEARDLASGGNKPKHDESDDNKWDPIYELKKNGFL